MRGCGSGCPRSSVRLEERIAALGDLGAGGSCGVRLEAAARTAGIDGGFRNRGAGSAARAHRGGQCRRASVALGAGGARYRIRPFPGVFRPPATTS